MQFRCIAMPTPKAAQFRTARVDDFGNPIRLLTADADTGYFCRHCLGQAGKGRQVLLGSYNVERPSGHYWQPSPIFLHAEGCEPFEGDNLIPPAIRAIQLVNVRPYDRDERMLYDLNDTVTGDRLAPLLQRWLEDERTAYLNVHTGRPGCFLCRVERL
jgi:hypothetical protein